MTARKFGPTIGSHLGKPIYETIQDEDSKFQFDRIAECDTEGCPLDQLKQDELMFKPGLIYKKTG